MKACLDGDAPGASDNATGQGVVVELPRGWAARRRLSAAASDLAGIWSVTTLGLATRNWHISGGFLMARGTPSHHPFRTMGFYLTKTIQLGGYTYFKKPPYHRFTADLTHDLDSKPMPFLVTNQESKPLSVTNLFLDGIARHVTYILALELLPSLIFCTPQRSQWKDIKGIGCETTSLVP